MTDFTLFWGKFAQPETRSAAECVFTAAELFTLMQTPVVASHRVRMELFWALFSQLTASLVLVAHFTMVI